MLIELSITNYRSLKNKTTLSLVPDGYESKSNNINVYQVDGNKTVRLHKVTLIFGSNGSGKSNIIRGLWELLEMLKSPNHEGDNLDFYDPFKFNTDTQDQPTEFEIKFLAENGTPYFYSVGFTKDEIVKEKLLYWPNGRETLAFEREVLNPPSKIHHLLIGPSAQEGSKQEKVYRNNFGLSHFSSLSPNSVILEGFNGLKRLSIVNSLHDGHRKNTSENLGKLLVNDITFTRKLNALIRYADLNITQVKATEKNDFKNQTGKEKYLFQTQHQLYKGDVRTKSEIDILLNEESQGSQTIIGLGSQMILVLENGGTLIVDEFETSLHPMLSKALIQIFQSEKLNPRKAQLIFTTHDTNLMDHNLFRRDQIWFTQKNERGETELFSMVDFDNLREGHVFEKWYLSGKFGALPKLDSIENAF